MEDINRDNLNNLINESTSRTMTNYKNILEEYTRIKWIKRKIVIPMKPKPSQRPRLSGYRIYVPGAAKNAAFFNKYVLPDYKSLFITTPCRIRLDVYVETPASFTSTQELLAEAKVLRPWSHTGDIDNYTKSALDCIQPNKKRKHRGIMYDDCLVIDCDSKKYYSMTPRYEIFIEYMDPKSISKNIENVLKLSKFMYMQPEEY